MMKVQEPRRTVSDKKMRSLMSTLSGCRNLKYPQQPITLSSAYNFEDLIDLPVLSDSYIEKVQLLQDIIALADVARNKSFTEDTSDRDLLSDIFTEIFIKAKELQNHENFGCVEDVTDEVNRIIEKFELKDKEPLSTRLSARSIKSTRDSEIRLIEADVNEFVLRLGNTDYYIRLLGREFILNGVVSDSVTFGEEICP
jgi:hypothetical protein